MRTNEGHPVIEERREGDSELSSALALPLHHRGVVERWTHPFHTYPARLHPDAAAALLGLADGPVYDPFAGGGTVLVEAMAAGRLCAGGDISPTAVRVARTRTRLVTEETLTAFRSAARRMTERARHADTLPPDELVEQVRDWYARHTVQELWSLLGDIREADEGIRELLEAVLSSILVKVSWRRSDTVARREVHERPPGTTAILFHKRARELARQLTSFREVVPDGATEPHIRMRDARRSWGVEQAGLVLTSPPYPAVYDYLPMQHLRDVWLGRRPDHDEEVSPRRAWRADPGGAVEHWRKDTLKWLRRAAQTLRPGGKLIVVIGDGLVGGGEIDAREPLRNLAWEAGLDWLAGASAARPDHARERVQWEHALAWERR